LFAVNQGKTPGNGDKISGAGLDGDNLLIQVGIGDKCILPRVNLQFQIPYGPFLKAKHNEKFKLKLNFDQYIYNEQAELSTISTLSYSHCV